MYYQRFKSIKEKLEEKYIPEPNSGCWLWIGANDGKRGYGNIKVNGGNKKAHRVSYEAYKGGIPEGYLVLHNCDNPCCINPDHLRIGNYKDNAEDRNKRNKDSFLKGKDHPHSKLDEISVKWARYDYYELCMTQREVAKKYGVSKTTMAQALNKSTWKHVK